MSKPAIPQGTRDFDAATIYRRQHIFNCIRKHFEQFGFEPLETPAMENLDTLMGKYGDEGDKLIFKILNNGLDRPEKAAQAMADFGQVLAGKNVKAITERALRYDLTIPFARYVAMNHGALVFPFKRYQLQPVWRADRPQKGRYREFYQCDADVVGTSSMLAEVDLVQLYDAVFTALKLPVTIRLNNRKVLAGLAEACGASDLLTPITVVMDKLDKIGLDAVMEQMAGLGLGEAAVKILLQYLNLQGDHDELLAGARSLLAASPMAMEGLEELETLWQMTKELGTAQQVSFDFTLARGLNYYTGTIFEVKAFGVQIGSIGGGGRYDDLTGLFGVKGIAGVGISFGLDRIFDCLTELNLFPADEAANRKVLLFHMGEQTTLAALRCMKQLRQQGILADMYPEKAKLDKQFKYAERKGYARVVIIGDNELENGTCVVKTLATGTQENLAITALADYLA